MIFLVFVKKGGVGHVSAFVGPCFFPKQFTVRGSKFI